MNWTAESGMKIKGIQTTWMMRATLKLTKSDWMSRPAAKRIAKPLPTSDTKNEPSRLDDSSRDHAGDRHEGDCRETADSKRQPSSGRVIAEEFLRQLRQELRR